MKRPKRYQRKINALNLIAYSPEITKKEFKQLVAFSRDKDPMIRCRVAEILMDKRLRNHASKKLLMHLACDRNNLVRTRAYSCLSVYDIFEVELFLKRAIQKEKSTSVCHHAIESWVDIVMSLHDDCEYDIYFVKGLLQQRKIQESEHCLLESYYALYQFGEPDMIPKIMKFLESKDISVRAAVLRILQEIVGEDNLLEVIEAMEELLKNTESWDLVKGILPYWRRFIVKYTEMTYKSSC